MTLYTGVGRQLCPYAVDASGIALARRGDAAMLPANIQFACVGPPRQYLYVASSNGGPGIVGDRHFATAFRIDSGGTLRRQGEDVMLPHRPIHITTDETSEHLLIAYNNPSSVTVHKIASDGGIGTEVRQSASLDAGVFAHQILVTPSNRQAILVTRGNDANGNTPEDPGALKVLTYHDGMLDNLLTIAPRGGYAFGPRNAAISPTSGWIYVSLERQNKLNVFKCDDGTIAAEPSFDVTTLSEPGNVRPKQLAGSVKVHPNGRFVYLANRAFGMTADEAFAGGENSIVVYAIDSETGRPDLIQSIDSNGISPRTFSIDPEGRTLVVGNSKALFVSKGRQRTRVEANVSMFSIGSDGRLTHASTHEVDAGSHELFWLGIA